MVTVTVIVLFKIITAQIGNHIVEINIYITVRRIYIMKCIVLILKH